MQMKKIFLAAISIVCLMASCTKDEMQADPINPNEGKEVVFSSSIGEATRTLYAEENGNKIAVKWVDGDLISVYGSTCAVNQSDYTVKAATGTETTDGVSTNYYYAESLTKTGDVGVQWGSEATSDFYAVYPSVGDNQFTKVDGGVKVQTTVRPKQNVTFTKTTASDGTTVTWVGQHYNGAASNPTMTDAVMYAYTADATSGEQVDLKFKPFSTVLRFTFKGYKGYQMDGENKIEYTSTVAVNKIVLTAPNTKIAGDFALTINEDGTASATEGTSNTIEIYPDYLPMKSNEQLQFDIFTIPTANVMPQDAEQAWKVQVVTDKGTFTFNMVPKAVTTPAEAPVAGLALTTGALHKLTIPLKTVTFDFDIPANNWIRYIPRNVYLSELSVPGAWNVSDLTNYQDGATLDQLYSDGVRAFHIDCRVSPNSASGRTNLTQSEEKQLVCAGTEEASSGLGLITGLDYTQGTSVKSVIETLIGKLSGTEYVVVVLTVAEKTCTWSYGVGTHKIGTVDPVTVLSYVKTMIDELQSYKHADGTPVVYNKEINPNTTVKDVLGHLIIKVNSNAQEEYSSTASDGTVTKSGFSTYSNLPNTLISAGSMASDTDFISGDIFGSAGDHAVANLFSAMQWEPMYWGAEPVVQDNVPFYFYYHQCQLTEDAEDASSGTTTPSLYDRKLAIDDIVATSETIYKQNTHSAWYQIGAGGYTQSTNFVGTHTNDQDAVANILNPYVQSIITAKLNQTEFTRTNGEKVVMSPSPIGIVLMNNAHTSGLDAVKAILEMNTKFYLNRDHDAEYGEWPDGNPFETTTPDDSGNNGGGTGGNDDGQIGEQ